MIETFTRRRALMGIAAILALASALPANAAPSSNAQLTSETKPKPRRPASDQITAGPCVPGQPEYSPDKCREDIMKP
jgi:hypothetical protein